MTPVTRDPSADPTPLDRASFYVEALKYGPGRGKLEMTTIGQVANQVEVLLRDAGVTSMTGRELLDALEFYCQSSASAYRAPLVLMRSVFIDGLMHGIALAGGLEGEHRGPREATCP